MTERTLEAIKRNFDVRIGVLMTAIQDLLLAVQNERLAYQVEIEGLKKQIEDLKNPKISRLKEELKKGVKVE